MRRFEMREVGTGRPLGLVEVLEDLGPGEVVTMFERGRVQLEVATQPVASELPTPPTKPARRAPK